MNSSKKALVSETILGALGTIVLIGVFVLGFMFFSTTEAIAETRTQGTHQLINANAVLEQFLQTPLQGYYSKEEVEASGIIEARYGYLTNEFKTDELAKHLGKQDVTVRELIMRMQYGLGIDIEQEGIIDNLLLTDSKMMLEILKLRAGLLNEILGRTWRLVIVYPDEEKVILNSPGIFYENSQVAEIFVQSPTPGEVVIVRLAIPKQGEAKHVKG